MGTLPPVSKMCPVRKRMGVDIHMHTCMPTYPHTPTHVHTGARGHIQVHMGTQSRKSYRESLEWKD